MLQNPRKTLGFEKNMVYEIPPGGGGKPYPASGLFISGDFHRIGLHKYAIYLEISTCVLFFSQHKCLD